MKKVVALSVVAVVITMLMGQSASAGLFGRLCCQPVCCTKVCVDYEYTVKVPVYEDREVTYKVCEWVKVEKEIECCVDRGCWEEYEVTVPVRKICYQPCFFGCFVRPVYYNPCCCNPCAPCCCEEVVTKICKRWVPNIVKETKTITVCVPQMVEKTRTVKCFTGCVDEVRTGKKWQYCCVPVCNPCAPVCGCK